VFGHLLLGHGLRGARLQAGVLGEVAPRAGDGGGGGKFGRRIPSQLVTEAVDVAPTGGELAFEVREIGLGLQRDAALLRRGVDLDGGVQELRVAPACEKPRPPCGRPSPRCPIRR
jgi:hypothetical protein